MKEAPKTKESQPGKRTIQLGQIFRPFDPTESLFERFRDHHPNFDTRRFLFILDLGTLKLPLEAKLETHAESRLEVISPFDPKLGYQITSEDFNLETRKTKVKKVHREWDRQGKDELDFLKVPLRLSIKTEQEFKFSPKEQDLLTREIPDFSRGIRVLAQFGQGGSFASKPSWAEKLTQAGFLEFDSFYPIDTGVLPQDHERFSVINQGFKICLPDDPEKLREIQLRFVILPQQMTDRC